MCSNYSKQSGSQSICKDSNDMDERKFAVDKYGGKKCITQTDIKEHLQRVSEIRTIYKTLDNQTLFAATCHTVTDRNMKYSTVP